MTMVAADWSIDRATGNIRYIGVDHTAAGTPSYATVIQFHRWLQAFADDAAFSGDDELDIIDKNPSDRSTDNIITLKNGFNVNATAIEHLYDGTIIQGSGLTEERWDGIVNFGQANAHIQVIQDGAILADDFWNYGVVEGAHDGAGDAAVLQDSGESWVTNEWVGYTIKNITDGSQALITANAGTTITGILYGGTDNDWDVSDDYHIAKPLNGDAAQGISHRFMLKTRDLGVDIDRRRLIGTSRRYYNTYAEFKINGTSQGNNVLALSDSNDLNNTTAWATIDALVDITNTEGLRLIDISGDTVDEEYYSEWTRGANSINTFFEYLKMMQADGSGETLNSLNGENFRGVSQSYAYDGETGTNFTTNDVGCYGTNIVFSGGSGAAVLGEEIFEDTATPLWKGRIVGIDDNTGTGSIIVDIEYGTVLTTQTFSTTNGFAGTVNGTPTAVSESGRIIIYAVDDDGTEGNMYGQILAGVAPVDDTRIYFGNATADVARYHDVDITVAARTISTPFVGVSTGSALIGAYGLGLEAGDTAAADTYFDLQNNPISPPNNVTFVASGFISGDYVLCTEDDGGDINFTQMVSDTTANSPTQTAISVVAIPSDTPSSAGSKGGIRVERDDGLYSLHRYTSWSAGTNDFTIPSADFSSNPATTPFNVFVTYLDLVTSLTSESFSYVYSSDRTHFLRVRDGGATPIKTAETTGVMSNTGGTASVNRIDDI
ncbi:hypothetical protein KAR91_77770 [Candidatus Pacearchaeota archaeon]|nr:hypothetical protein [Candidatus Pacearchaeota archaeon]